MKRAPLRFASRKDAVRQLRERLESGGWPRLQMLLLVTLTGGAGFVASSVLLILGLRQMGLRYLLACCVAYLCFLALLSIWLHWRRGDAIDAADAFPQHSPGPDDLWDGSGGGSGGAGASAHFDAPGASAAPSESGFDLPDMDVDVEAIPIMLVLLVAGLVLSSLFVVWTAPVLFAELMLDGMLAAGLYSRLRHIETRHWLQTALRKTVWPFVLTTALLTAVGFGVQAAVPQADSIGDMLQLLPHLR